jgi:hypothetical protein
MKNTNNEIKDLEEAIKQNKLLEASKILEEAIEKFNKLQIQKMYTEK